MGLQCLGSSLDMLKMGLHHAVPSVGVDPSAPSVDVAEKMWPLIRAMAENALESNVECIFEGDMIVPKHAAELRAVGGEKVRSCFVGYLDIEPRQKCAEIRRRANVAELPRARRSAIFLCPTIP